MKSGSLFDDLVVDAPRTEGIKYAGSKLKLLPQILELANSTGVTSVFDGFSGTTRVGQAFAKMGYTVTTNDASVWSKIFGTCYLLNRKERSTYSDLIEHLNSIAAIDGWYTANYGGIVSENYNHNGLQPDGTKKPWQVKNTRKLDGIRQEIERLNLDEISKAVALTSLIRALDQVDNTLGHYVSYLKDWSPRSFNDLELKVPQVWPNREPHSVLSGDVFEALTSVNSELAYFDPPYGSNNEKMPPSRVRYLSYYHPWTTICLDDQPDLFGKAARRVDTSDKVAASDFEEFRKSKAGRFIAIEKIEELIKETPCEWIILSYSSGGRATAEELNEIFHSNGSLVKTLEVDYKKNVMGGMTWTNEWLREAETPNREFMFLLQKS